MTDIGDWRLIRSGYLSGAMNMALDDALLHAVAEGVSRPILRLYRWRPATLTLGYAQSVVDSVDTAACRAAGIDVVRRPTGGRAVFHDREVTYAVIAPVGGRFGSTVAESYRVIAGVLKEALCRFGLPAELVPGQMRGQTGRAVCFTAPAQHELLIAGCKVAGCAQKRRGGAFLQHGSIPLDLDLDLLQRLMPAAPGEDPAGRFRSIGWLNRFAPRPLSIDEVESALVDSFTKELGARLVPDEPCAAEVAAAARLCDAWYGNHAWTVGGPGVRADE
ncbi:MAG: lipoate--protein ligase family protein [Deltaproteobacteria bacterium]|nr:MAG: lipoate--protein ligase family protein [Deltaproteobacteria bacterium]